MTSRQTLVDTGPLVAAFDRSEQHHLWAVEQLRALAPPLLTCEAVMSETAFLLKRAGASAAAPLQMAERGMLQIVPVVHSGDDATRVRLLMERYRDLPMSYADACLMLLAERFSNAQILTLDSDFRVYRKTNGEAVHLLAP